MEDPFTVRTWWAHPSNLALVVLAGFAFVVGTMATPYRPWSIEADMERG